MSTLFLVTWRDMPAQILAGKGRGAERHPLPERFEQAIDRAAMKAGLAGTDDYLSQWQKRPAPPGADTAAALAAEIERTYPTERLKALIDNDGWEV